MYMALSQMAHLFQAALCYLGPGGVQYIVSRLEEDKFSESWVGHVTFFTTVHTCIPLVISVPIVCKTQILMNSINKCMDGSRFSSQGCCLTVV